MREREKETERGRGREGGESTICKSKRAGNETTLVDGTVRTYGIVKRLILNGGNALYTLFLTHYLYGAGVVTCKALNF